MHRVEKPCLQNRGKIQVDAMFEPVAAGALLVDQSQRGMCDALAVTHLPDTLVLLTLN